MKKSEYHFTRIVLLLALMLSSLLYAQDPLYSRKEASPLFTIRGSVLDTEFMKPVSKVNVEVVGGNYTATNAAGEFTIRARIGDELVFKNTGFETVYYTIKDRQRIRVEVQPLQESEALNSDERQKRQKEQISFDTYLQRAINSFKDDAKVGIDNVALALEQDEASPTKRAEAFALLGDIYSFWKQYDLAVANYKLSIKNKDDILINVSLAKAYFKNKNYQESIDLFTSLKGKSLVPEVRISVLEGLGDAQKATGLYANAITNYKEAQDIAQEKGNIAVAVRLNASIASTYDLQGSDQEALESYDETLELSEQTNSSNTVRTKTQVADYLNRRQDYDEEITLRKEVLNTLSEIETDTISNDDVLTPQKQNYKIANAYVLQQKPEEAIPFFEKSIESAVENEDIIVEKDATRRLSELFRDKGDFDKAIESYERYIALVDESYVLKEQEIRQVSRFTKDIAEKQNRILSLEKDRELNESRYQLAFQEQELASAKYNRQRLIIISLLVVALLLMATAYAIFRSYKQQKYANNLLALRGLRSQMNPHFIFNALNSVNSFIATSDERTANRYLSDFSSLMRAVLENSEEDFIPLSKEIELIKKYVMLEHFRFKDKFDYTLEVDEYLNIEAFEIPPMLLQPYVENAVWHGLRYKEEMGHLTISFAQKDKKTATITVTDDGVGRAKSKAMKTRNQKKQQSKGMSNIKKRVAILNEMYDDRVDVVIEDALPNGEGTKVVLTLKKD